MILASDFSTYVVWPALMSLKPLGIPATPTAHNLLMGTAAIESSLGTQLVQEQGGPALGVFMIEPASLATLQDQLSPELAAFVNGLLPPGADVKARIVTDLMLAAVICRLFYWVVPKPLPANTVSGLWSYYKTYYNTAAGAATEVAWLRQWKLTGISLPA